MRMPIPFALAASLFAGAARADALDDAIERMMQSRQVPGLALVVVKDGEIIRERGYGLANVELGVPVTPDTVFPPRRCRGCSRQNGFHLSRHRRNTSAVRQG